jgi:hypothetical protein
MYTAKTISATMTAAPLMWFGGELPPNNRSWLNGKN